MSTRAGSKQARQTTKGGTKALGKDQTKNEKQTTNVLEIVPGKFNETDWLSLLENDDTEDFIADIFDGIWIETSKQIQQLYIRRQLLPFTLMMTENALSNVIQWAFMERDEPKPASANFWTEDAEPIPSTMDNWGEGVVPACREERPQSIEESPLSLIDRPITAPLTKPIHDSLDQYRRPSTGSSGLSADRTTRSSSLRQRLPHSSKSDRSHEQNKQEKSMDIITDDRLSFEKESLHEKYSNDSLSREKPYYHDLLVIQSQPPKLEPLSDLFYPPQVDAHSSYLDSTPATITKKYRHMAAPKLSSQLGSDALASTTNLTGTTTSKSFRKPSDSKIFGDINIEEAISKAPVAAHSMLKSILSRPPGYRELELDDNGNVITLAKLDPDKIASRSIRVKYDVIPSTKVPSEIRPPPAKPSRKTKPNRLGTQFTAVKLVLPEQSTDVGDLIQPIPGVLYEDGRLKKGDPRRYQTGLPKYASFYNEDHPLKPIAQRKDLSVLQVANELLSHTKDGNKDDDNDVDLEMPKLQRLARIPPIMSTSSTTST